MKVLSSIKYIIFFTSSVWIIHLISLVIPLQQYGLIPRTTDGLIGIITAPFLHGNLAHLIANTIGLLTLGIIFSIIEHEETFETIIFIILVEGILTWCFARSAIHIGASGIIFGFLGYLIFLGYFFKKITYIFTSLFVLFAYGSMIFGIIPGTPGISWEGHLFGFMGGAIAAKFKKP